MTTIFLIFLIALIVSTVGTGLAIPFAKHTGMLDRPDGYRKIHEHPVPRFGGPGIFIAFFVPIICLLYFSHKSNVADVLVEQPSVLLGLFAGGGMALLLGVVDDRFDLRPRWKLLWQILIGLMVCWFDFGITVISNPFGQPFVLGIFSWPVTVLWFVACMNAVNMADGMDGLAAGICLFVSLTLFFLSLEFTNVLGLLLMASLAGAILGFLMYNFPPAKIFLGDSGSMLLGFLVAALSLVASKKAEAALALFIPVIALGLPILDTSMAIVRRWYHGLPLSSPDREHIHHILVAMGFTRRRAVLILYGISLLLGGAALVVSIGHGEVVFLVIIFLLLTVYASLRIFGQVTFRDIIARLALDEKERRRSMMALTATNQVVSQAALVRSVEELWQSCFPVFEALELTSAKLELYQKCNGNEGSSPSQMQNRILTWNKSEESVIHGDSVDSQSSAENGSTSHCMDRWMVSFALRHDEICLGEFSVNRLADVNPALLPEASALLVRLRGKLVAEISRLS